MKIFLDSDIFFECLESDSNRSILSRARNRDYSLYTSLTVIGEILLVLFNKGQSHDFMRVISLFEELNVIILVPDDNVANICYTFSLDDTDGRIIGQKSDRTHLAYAMAYNCDYFLTTDDALIRYRIPSELTDAKFSKPETLPLDEFKYRILNH